MGETSAEQLLPCLLLGLMRPAPQRSQRKDNGSAMDRVGVGPGRGRRHVPRSNLAGASEPVRQSYRQDDSKHQGSHLRIVLA
jgi:hypothetical protein